jgi:hypothetical protein
MGASFHGRTAVEHWVDGDVSAVVDHISFFLVLGNALVLQYDSKI